jgi:hypothetical protein
MLYTRMFLQTLKPKCLAKLEQFPGLFDRQALLAARDLYAFDNVVTAPLHGYRDTDDYWHRASARHVLHDITVPTLVLNARNDPFLPGATCRKRRAAVTLEYPEEGGHVGFPTAPSRAGSTGCRAASCIFRWDEATSCAPAALWELCEAEIMDDIVKQAMAKWPNVPHCYGWLALDARGGWRMRDEAAQQAGAPGDKLNNPPWSASSTATTSTTTRPLVFPERPAARLRQPRSDALHRAHRSGAGPGAADRRRRWLRRRALPDRSRARPSCRRATSCCPGRRPRRGAIAEDRHWNWTARCGLGRSADGAGWTARRAS